MWGLLGYKRQHDPFRKSKMFRNEVFAHKMPGYRFQMLKRAAHFNNNSKDRKPGHVGDKSSPIYDRLYKIRKILNCFVKAWTKAYYPHLEVSIDEMMVNNY